MLGPERSLPTSPEFEDSESYVDSLLEFVSSSDLLRTLCGGVHMLDFFTRIPDLYSQVLPQEWRSFFQAHDIMDILDLCMREDLDIFNQDDLSQWREGPVPPASLLQYIGDIRRYSLNREFAPRKSDAQKKTHKLATNVALGMKVKKVHEVSEFASYVDRLTADIAETREQGITHIVDFGSGRNYLGRALASNPYNKHIIAVESRAHNIEGAKNFDERAELAPRIRPLRNKKEFRAQPKGQPGDGTADDKPPAKRDVKGERRGVFARDKSPPPEPTGRATLQISAKGVGSIQYVEHYIKDGNLSRVIDQIVDQDAIRENVKGDLVEADKGATDQFVQGNVSIEDDIKAEDPRLMVISLHSCGNLVHHGIRSLMLNPAVSAVALIGCCYNLITERLPPTQLPTLRTKHPRLEKSSNTHDPHGFPMSERLCNYAAAPGKDFRLNITARMMAVQAPYNWGRKDSEGFFGRHFYRALLQRIFLDCGIVEQPNNEHVETNDSSPLGWSGGTAPINIGSLRKSCYANFVSYVRGALDKLVQDPERGAEFQEKMGHLTDEEILQYEEKYSERKKELNVIWSLMAFSANVVEAVIVVDRWLYLKEHDEIAEAFVEPVFEYAQSPRNLVVVGIKK